MSSQGTPDFLVVGAGVIGVTVARDLRRRFQAKVIVIDKEPRAGLHASGRNSGVLHAGIYYKAHSLKARFCIAGNRRMKEYCRDKGIPLNEHGKVIVAQGQKDFPALHELWSRAVENGVEVSLLDQRAVLEIEPCAKTAGQALYVKGTAVVDPEKVMEALIRDAKEEGIDFRFNCEWSGIDRDRQGSMKTSQGPMSYGHLVNCAGLFADRIAHQLGVGTQYRILPFRGHYYLLSPLSRVKVRGNIYPVPDLRNPFLGVHFTRRPNGEVTVGPSALPILGREHYHGFAGANIGDALGMLRFLAGLKYGAVYLPQACRAKRIVEGSISGTAAANIELKLTIALKLATKLD